MDVPRVIPCMPGAELTETVDESTWKARMDVKLGPMALTFATDVRREEADREAMRAMLATTARELRGRCAGRARIESTLAPHERRDARLDQHRPDASGAVAQTGRGLVAGRLGPARAELRRLPRRRSSQARRRRPRPRSPRQAGPVPRALARAARALAARHRFPPPLARPDPNLTQGGSACHRSHSPSTAPATRWRSSRGRCSSDCIRDGLGLTGTKIGCETRQCGACTVHLDGLAVKSCTVLAVQADGGTVTTIEGLAGAAGCTRCRRRSGSNHGLQCGFCTPGMIMSAVDLLARPARLHGRPRSGTGSRATSAAAPATRTSSRRSAQAARWR